MKIVKWISQGSQNLEALVDAKDLIKVLNSICSIGSEIEFVGDDGKTYRVEAQLVVSEKPKIVN